jgi:hypothetical protein
VTHVVERFPAGEPWRIKFPDAVQVAAAEGGAVYAAEADGAWWLISDESTMAEFLSEEDRMGVVAVTRFTRRAPWVAAATQRRRSLTRLARAAAWPDEPLLAAAAAQAAQILASRQDLAARGAANERDHLQPVVTEALRGAARAGATVSTQRVAALPSWPRLGHFDLAVESPAGIAVVELKCGRGTDAAGACIWDSAKLAVAIQERAIDAGFLLAGAPVADWQRPIRGAELFEDDVHDAELTRLLHRDWWAHWESRGDPWPTHVPATIRTRPVARASFSLGEVAWELRLAEVRPVDDRRVPWPSFGAD